MNCETNQAPYPLKQAGKFVNSHCQFRPDPVVSGNSDLIQKAPIKTPLSACQRTLSSAPGLICGWHPGDCLTPITGWGKN